MLTLAGLAMVSPEAHGQRVQWSAEAALEGRIFPGTPLASRQHPTALSPSFVFRPEASWESASGAWQLRGEGFLRIDTHDSNRTHFDIRELGILTYTDWGAAYAGMGRVFWGVTEIRHLVDVVNQTDGVEDVDGEEKLGQPMISVTVDTDWGTLDLFALPYARERRHPATDARLGGVLPISDDVVFESSLGRWYPGFAARWFQTIGALDVGVSGFHGTSREPRFTWEAGPGSSSVLVPTYDIITQLGFDAQWTGDATLLKLEGMARTGHGSAILAFTAGVEHTLHGLWGTTADLGLVGELMLDSRDDAAPPTAFNRDVFFGMRWALNDPSSTTVLGGPVLDVDSGELLVIVEAERRIGSSWQIGLDVRAFANTRSGSVLHGIRKDSHLTVSVRRFF